jgi:hypothetical protein
MSIFAARAEVPSTKVRKTGLESVKVIIAEDVEDGEEPADDIVGQQQKRFRGGERLAEACS